MPLFRRRLPRPGLTDKIWVRSDRDRGDLIYWIQQGLHDLASRVDQGVPAWELQLVVQICPPSRYPAWRDGREKRWRTDPYTTRNWPPALKPTEAAALLLPVPAGRVGSSALGRHPRNTVSPLFVRVPSVGKPADAALTLVCSWVCNPAPGVTACLAPPVIEEVGYRRTVENYGLDWPLPPADGV